MSSGGAEGEGEEAGVGCTHRTDTNSTAKFLKMEMALESQPIEGMLGLWAEVSQLNLLPKQRNQHSPKIVTGPSIS